MCNELRRQQEEKQRALQQKESRKKIREEKKNGKSQSKNETDHKNQSRNKKGKRTIEVNEEEMHIRKHNKSDEEIVFDDESDESLNLDKNACNACGGNNRWDDDNAWLGCSKCPLWFHKDCISEDAAAMSLAEIIKFKFYCKACEKAMKRK